LDAIEMLKQQHREVEKLFEQFETAEESEKAELADTISDKLAVHATIEEQHFYPATKSARTEDLLRDAVEEHLAAKRVIADILDCEASDPQFEAKVKVLREIVQHHVEEEERVLFPTVTKLFVKDELEDLAVVMQDAAEELEQGAPREKVPSEIRGPAPIE
jgi:hemerythrin superfamily protein